MKKIFLFSIVLLAASNLVAQNGQLNDYRRNSLATMMIYHSEDTFGLEIYNAFQAIPTPDKYDDHNVDIRVIENDSIHNVQKKKNGLYKAKYGKTLTSGEIQRNGLALEELLNVGQVGNMLVAKWFGLDLNEWQNSAFNTELLQVRGQYNASEIDVEKARLTARGLVALSDAGEELLGNTFVLINDMTYVTAEERADAAKKTMNVLGGIFDALTGGNTGSDMAKTAGAIADAFTGFTVKTHSYLFQLQWNDSVAAIFYNNYYTSVPDQEKILAFFSDTTSFRVKYVAHEYEYDGKTEVKGKYSRNELVKMSCTRSMDKNIASLQLQYEDFKVKTPVYAVEYNEKGKLLGYAAKIGMKEGITEKSSFQVVERKVDPETGRTTYKYVATVKPLKGKIWDNRYNAVTESAVGSELNSTLFKKVSGGEILPGMLLIEGKYRKVTE